MPHKEELALGKPLKVRYRMDLLSKMIAAHKVFLAELNSRLQRLQPNDALTEVFEAVQARLGNLYTAYLTNATPQLVAEDMQRSPKLKQWFDVRLRVPTLRLFAQSKRGGDGVPPFGELLELPEYRLTVYPQVLQRWIAAVPKEHKESARLRTAQMALVDLCFNAMSEKGGNGKSTTPGALPAPHHRPESPR